MSRLFGDLVDLSREAERNAIWDHMSQCQFCWGRFNIMRWQQAELAAKETKNSPLAELREYLGDKFEWGYDGMVAVRDAWIEQRPSTEAEVINFYRMSTDFLYDTVLHNATGERYGYDKELIALARRYAAETLLDYGCGTGCVGLHLLEAGLEVKFMDLPSPSIDFLKWRLSKRGHSAQVLLVGEDEIPTSELVYSLSTFEHIVNPLPVVGEIARKTKILAFHAPFGSRASTIQPMHLHDISMLSRMQKILRQSGFRQVSDKPLQVFTKLS